MKTSVMVVGTGPAGMLAAYGALLEGCEVTMVAPPAAPIRSKIHGAQYIHAQIEGLPDEIQPFNIRYRHFGTEEGYRKKIYGDNVPVDGTSWGSFKPYEIAWSMGEVYEWLATTMILVDGAAAFVRMEVTEEDLVHFTERYDFVFNTAPLNKICPDGVFLTETVYVTGGNPLAVPEDEIHYYGDPAIVPYRASNIRGVTSTEFPAGAYESMGWLLKLQVRPVVKPLSCSNVGMHGVYRLGRYGKWHKGILAHEAYEEARRVIRKGLPWTATLPA